MDLGLVEKIRIKLTHQGIETSGCDLEGRDPESSITVIANRFKDVMNALHLDLSDDSLHGTPNRVAKMFVEEVFYGLDYANFPKCTTVANKMQYDELIPTRVSIKSMCEHHFVPFVGTAWIGYLPATKILGLSKFNRVADFFSRRPQIQERLTAQIHTALSVILDTENIAVVIRCTHMCVQLRGIQDQHGVTVTSKMAGKFRDNAALREEFLALTRT